MSSFAFTVLVWTGYAILSMSIFYFGWKQIKKMSGGGTQKRIRSSDQPIFTHRAKSGLQSDILAEGTGPGAKNRDVLTVHYTAYLTNGQQVDSSRERGRTLTFKLGTGAVIYGWDEALQGAKVGEKRRVTVPPKLAYGNKGTQRIPPNSTVIFEVELLKIDPA